MSGTSMDRDRRKLVSCWRQQYVPVRPPMERSVSLSPITGGCCSFIKRPCLPVWPEAFPTSMKNGAGSSDRRVHGSSVVRCATWLAGKPFPPSWLRWFPCWWRHSFSLACIASVHSARTGRHYSQDATAARGVDPGGTVTPVSIRVADVTVTTTPEDIYNLIHCLLQP